MIFPTPSDLKQIVLKVEMKRVVDNLLQFGYCSTNCQEIAQEASNSGHKVVQNSMNEWTIYSDARFFLSNKSEGTAKRV